MTLSIYIPTNSARGFPFSIPSPAFIVCRFFFVVVGGGLSDQCEVVVLIYISLTISEVHHFSCASWPSSLDICIFRSSDHFLIGLFVFSILSFNCENHPFTSPYKCGYPL